MCLIALALDHDRRFPLVVAANRDEYFERPAQRLAWWTPEGGGPAVLSGRDLRSGGTWMGLSAEGRLAMVTNVRQGRPAPDPAAPSRGQIPLRWLRGDLRADQFWPGVALGGHEPFNLIAADFRAGECFWATSERACPQRLERGLFGLSNGALDDPWPKSERLKSHLGAALGAADSSDQLASMLFAALAEREPAPDDLLPATGVPREVERMLSSAFIRSPDGRYGTRVSTVLVAERVGKRLVTQVFERTFTAGPGVALLRRSMLKDWPPKYLLDDGEDIRHQVEVGPVDEGSLAETLELPVPTARRRRVRSLLRPVDR